MYTKPIWNQNYWISGHLLKCPSAYSEALRPGTYGSTLPELDFNEEGVGVKPTEFMGIIKLTSLWSVSLEGVCLLELKKEPKDKWALSNADY